MEKVEKVFKFYQMAVRLKDVIRTGWKYWAVERERVESVAEHVYGTLMLAVGVYASYGKELDVDIERVALMLALHETEEIVIGDLTFYEEEYKDKKAVGRKAVEEMFKDFANKDVFLSLIEEFENGQTKNAKFAYMCDKMEAVLQAYLYKDNFNYQKIAKKALEHDKIRAMQAKGLSRPEQYFLDDNIKLFEKDKVFSQIAKYLKELEK